MVIKRIEDFEKSLNRLQEAVNKAFFSIQNEDYPFFRDSAIQRFEFTVEIMWKSIKHFLLINEGIECVSPKKCLREFFVVSNLDEEDAKTALKMIDDRNLTSHTYHEEVAEEIFSNLKDYVELMKKILLIIKG